MKIICVGRNYVKHIEELNNEVPSDPVLFLKPETSIIHKNMPFFIPDFSNNIHYEVEVVIRINRLGKHIQEKFAHKYYNQFTLGIDFTARDVQDECKQKGLPWEKAKAFDGSAFVGEMHDLSTIEDINNLKFQLLRNGNMVQNGNTSHMIFKINSLIAHISRYFTLKIGDLIFTGTPAGVGKVEKDDLLELFVDDKKIASLNVK